jgi:ATP-dependent protease ClpP protease subunit
MPRFSREDIDRYFDHGIFAPKRIVYIGSTKDDCSDNESGTDYTMSEKAVKAITYLDTVSDKPIIAIMNNIGGEWAHGMAIYDTIVACRCHVTIIAVGYCCSMGSVILQSADLRVIATNCLFLIHDGTEAVNTHTRNFEAWAKESEKNRLTMYQIYKGKMKEKNPKITIKQIEKLCTIDKIYSPQEAIDVGLADELLGDINLYIKE